MLTVSFKTHNTISFKSNPERERELAALRKLILQQLEQRRQEEIRKAELMVEAQKERDKVIAGFTTNLKINTRTPDIEPETGNNFPLNTQNAKDKATILAQAQKEREKALSNFTHQNTLYPSLDNDMSTKVAGFLTQFTCAIQNNSEHDIQEFFGDDETASKLREKLSPDCQHDSIELRNELKKINETQDPIMMLMAANKMKKFAPKDGILSEEGKEKLLEGLKDSIIMSIKNTDLSKFAEEDRIAINEMVQMIRVADSVDFGISVKLKLLVDKINNKKLNLGFIPPVQVRHFNVQTNTMEA